MRCIIKQGKEEIIDLLNDVMNNTDLITLEAKFKKLGEELSINFIVDDDQSMSNLSDIITEWIPIAREVADLFDNTPQVNLLDELAETKNIRIADLRKSGVKPASKSVVNVSMDIKEDSIIDYQEKVTSETINNLYRSAQQPKTLMQEQLRREVISAFLVDFKAGHIVRSSEEFNRNLTNLFNRLVEDLVSYANELKVESDPALALYDKDGNYTGQFSVVQKLANTLFGNKFTATYLNTLYTTRISNYRSAAALKAYNSYVILNNFDTLLKRELSKSIVVDQSYVNSFVDASKEKYKLLNDSNLVKTWRSSDDIDALVEMGNITKILLEQTPIVKNGTTDNKYSNYLEVKDFTYVFNKLKNTPIFTEVADKIRFAPNKFIPLLIERALDSKVLTAHEKDILYSVQRRFYRNSYNSHADEEYSLLEIMNKEYGEGHNGIAVRNLIDCISGMIDKTVPTNYLQYRPSDSGNMEAFNIKDTDVNNHKRMIESGINNINNTIGVEYREDLLETYGVTRRGVQVFINIPGYTTAKGTKIRLVYSNNDRRDPIVYEVTPHGAEIPLSIENLTKMVLDGDTDLTTALIALLDDTIYQSLDMQEELLDAFSEITNSSSKIRSIIHLAALSGRSIMRNQLQSELDSGKLTKSELGALFPQEYSSDKVLFNRKTGLLNTVLPDHAHIIRDIARARMLVNGEVAKNNSKDLSGNSVSNNGLTNLINTCKVVWQDAKHQAAHGKNIASVHSIFVQNPNLLFGTTVKKGAQSKDRAIVKASSKFTAPEVAHSAILYDFWSGILNTEGETSGKFYIQPTVYSDKSRHYLIGIDGNQILSLVSDPTTDSLIGGKSIKDSTPQELRDMHFATMSNMYDVMRDNLISDYASTFSPLFSDPVLASLLPPTDILTFKDAKDVFNAINDIYKLKGDIEFRQSKRIPISPEEKAWYSKILTTRIGVAKTPKALYKQLAAETDTLVIDEIHFSGRDTIGVNKLLDHYFTMFLDEASTRKIYNQRTIREKKKFARDLLNNNKFYLYDRRGNIDPIIQKFIKGNSGDAYGAIAGPDYEQKWIDQDTSELIIAKLVDSNGKETRLTKNSLFSPRDSQGIILNPLFDMYFEVDNLISSNFLTSTVGGSYGHPFKVSLDAGVDEETKIEQEEAARTLAQLKRMVIYPATMHNLVQNQLNGTVPEYNIAVIEDMSAQAFNFSGATKNVDVQDGCGWATPFVSVLENNSLNDSKVGDDKKPIGHSMNGEYLSELELKYALMDIYGERSGMSLNSDIKWKEILKKMTDRPWDVLIDLTIDFNGNPINILEHIKNPYYLDIATSKFYKITDIQNAGDSIYNVFQVEVDNMGNTIGESHLKNGMPILIDTNYKLWQTFGGEWSCDLTETGLFEGDSSVHAVVWYMNNIGIIRSKENALKYGIDFKQELYTFNDIHEVLPTHDSIVDDNSKFRDFANLSQVEVYQPLKHSDIHYLVNTSGAKCGAANINPVSSWSDSSPLRSFKMSTRHLGIQMDADHHADNSELTEMSQVVAAATANGYTHPIAKELYQDLGAIVNSTMKREIDAIAEFYKLGDSRAIYDIVGKAFLKSFGDSSNSKSSLAEAIIYNLKKELGKYLKISDSDVKLPFSDNNLLGAVISNMTSQINRSAIKRKYSGIAAVLVPSYGAIQVFRDRKVNKDGVVASTTYTYNQALKKRVDFDEIFNSEPVIDISYIEMGENYLEVDIDGNAIDPAANIKVDTIEKYRELRDSTSNIKVKRNPYKGRDLQPSRTSFTVGGKPFNVYDTDAILFRYGIESIFNKNKGIIAKARKGEDVSKMLQSLQKEFAIPEAIPLITKLVNKLAAKDFWRIDTITDDIKNIYRDNAINMFKQLSNGVVSLGGSIVNIDENSLQTQEAELILPKIYATKFGLRRGDSLDDILNNENFFYERISEAWSDKTSKYDIALKKSNGNHTYIILKGGNNSKVVEDLTKLEVSTINEDGEHTLRINNKGEIAGPLNDAEVYVDSRGNEIIFTDNINQFLEEQYNDYDDIVINSGLKAGDLEYAFNVVVGIDHKLTDEYKRMAQTLESESKTTLTLELQSKKTKRSKMFARLSSEKRTSFLKSLEFLAARIPAQSMQSFMPMKVVAFSESEKNVAYVSHWQIWLQGSDFDIDKVYLMGSEFTDNGKYIGWSPYFDLSSDENRRASELLPMPSGKEYKVFYSKELPVNAFDITLLVKNINIATADKAGTNNKQYLLGLSSLLRSIRDSNYTELWLDPASTSDEDWVNTNTIEKLINKHSLYVSKIKSVDRKIAMMKNSVSSKLFRIINDPVNMVSAYSPIEMNEPQDAAETSVLGREAKEYVADNPFVKFNMQYQNMTGKDVIGITAVGEKIFFALSYYFNEAVRSGNREWQENAIFKRSFPVIKSRDGKTYLPFVRNLITNVNFDDIDINTTLWGPIIQGQSIVSADDVTNYSEEEFAYIEETLTRQLGSEKDASLVISALLSAATDNAKELILAKINSGSDLAGVYLYAIMMGIDFKDIASLMTSDTVQIIAKLNTTNIFDEYNQSSTIDKILDKLDNGLSISSYLSNYNDVDIALSKVVPTTDLSTQQVISKIFESDNRLMLIKQLREEVMKTDTYKNNGFPKYNLMRFMNDLEELAVMSDKINKSETSKTEYNTFKMMYKLSQEIKQLGSILGANQGLKTSMFDKISYLDRIEQVVKSRTSEYMMGKKNERSISISSIYTDKKDILESIHGSGAREYVESIVNLAESRDMIKDFNSLKFLNDPEYRRIAIAYYNLIKGTINVLDVISKVPHFRATIDLAATDFGIFDAISAKFSNIYNLSKHMSNNIYKVNSKKEKDGIYKGVSDYLDNIIITKWFRERGTSFTINKGDSYYDASGKSKVANGNETIKLDTSEGQATFKKWFDNSVIPSIKRGLESKGGDKRLTLARNKFVSSLQLTISDRTLTRDISYIWALPINMANISSVTEVNNYVEYLTHFDELDKYTFNGTPVSVLFFYYNLIVNKNRYGQSSLTRIFEHFVDEKKDSEIHKFFKYIGDMDYNRFLSEVDLNMEDLSLSCALPVSSTNYTKEYPYIKIFNGSTQTYDIYKYSPQTDNQYEENYNEFYEEYDLGDESYDDTSYGNRNIPNYSLIEFDNPKDMFNYFPYLSPNYNTRIIEESLEDKVNKLIKQNRAIVKNEC